MRDTRTYTELVQLESFNERFSYLALNGRVGDATFGSERYLNQRFYTSRAWRNLRHHVIARDLGCDLGVEGYEVHRQITIHHMNPITRQDLLEFNEDILNPEYLIAVSDRTHKAIHYGDEGLLPQPFVERQPGDTAPWRMTP